MAGYFARACTFLIIAGMPLGLAGAECYVIVACEMTKAGSAMAQATPSRPVYYSLHLSGYTDGGKQWGTGDEETTPLPSNAMVLRLVNDELAAQSYLPVEQTFASHHPAHPSLILNVHWGYIIDPIISRNIGVQGNKVGSAVQPSAAMLRLIGAPTDNLQEEKGDYPQDAMVPRYYIIIDTYDYSAFEQSHQKVLLWRTKMSVPATQYETLAATIGPMLRAGGAQFGRNLTLPINVAGKEVPPGTVEVGNPTVVGGKR